MSKKKQVVTFAASLVVSVGVGMVMGTAFRQIPQAHLSRGQKLIFDIGAVGITLAVGHIVEREVKAVVNEAMTGYERAMEGL